MHRVCETSLVYNFTVAKLRLRLWREIFLWLLERKESFTQVHWNAQVQQQSIHSTKFGQWVNILDINGCICFNILVRINFQNALTSDKEIFVFTKNIVFKVKYDAVFWNLIWGFQILFLSKLYARSSIQVLKNKCDIWY